MAFALAWFTQGKPIDVALSIAALVWLGFIATVMLGMVLWERKPFALYVLNSVYQLVNVLLITLVLSLW